MDIADGAARDARSWVESKVYNRRIDYCLGRAFRVLLGTRWRGRTSENRYPTRNAELPEHTPSQK